MRENKSTNPVISVIVPVYNVEKYLNRCLESIINQTYKELEIILVDDGSTDASSKICDFYLSKDKRIKIIHKENGGIVSARKAGIQKATGEYIAYVDSDDWIEADMYETMIQEAVKNDADIVTSGLYRDYEKSFVMETDHVSVGVYDVKQIEDEILPVMIYTGRFFESGIKVHLYNKLYKKKIVLNNQLQIEDVVRVGEDAALVYPCMLDANKIVILHRCFYHYCIRKDSTMGFGYQEEFLGYQNIYKIIKNKILKNHKKEDILLKQLNYLMIYLLLLKEPQTILSIKEDMLFPFNNVNINDRVILYGGGKFGISLHRFLMENKICKIVCWMDKFEDAERGIVDISKLKTISNESYDKVIIAVLVKRFIDDIHKKLIEIGIDERKIVAINFENIVPKTKIDIY